MAYTPSLAEIRYLLARRKWMGEVIAAGPYANIPQYPNPIRGDRYFDTTNNRFMECRWDRRWTHAFYTTPAKGAVYALRSTGQQYILSQSSGWQPYEEFLAALGTYLGSGGGSSTVLDPVNTTTALRAVPGSALTGGELVSVRGVSQTFGPLSATLPVTYTYSTTFNTSWFPDPTALEPTFVVPTDRIGPGTGCWFNLSVLMNTIINYGSGLAFFTPTILEVTVPAGADLFFDIGAGDAFPINSRVTKVWLRCTANVPGGTMQMMDAAGGLGNAITDTIPCAVADNLGYAGALTNFSDITAGTTPSILKSGATVAGVVYIEYMKV